MTEEATEQIQVPYPNGTTQATHDQQKPLFKMLRKLMQPRHPRTRKFVKPKVQRKTKRQQYY